MFNKKIHHINNHITTIITKNKKITLKTLKLINIKYKVLKPIISINKTITKNTPIIHNKPIIYITNTPNTLKNNNNHTTQHNKHIIINFPINSHPHKNITTNIHNHINNINKNFTNTNIIIKQTYNSTQTQQCPTKTHIYFTHINNNHLIIHTSTQIP